MGLSKDRGRSSIRRSSCNLAASESRRAQGKPRESGISWRREIMLHGQISGVEPCTSSGNDDKENERDMDVRLLLLVSRWFFRQGLGHCRHFLVIVLIENQPFTY